MPVIHGFNGAVKVADTSAVMQELTSGATDITVSTDMPLADITGFGSVAKSYVAGQYSWKVDIKGWFGLGAANAMDTVLGPLSISTARGSVLAYPEGATAGKVYYGGSAWCSNYSRSAGLGGGVGVSASFQGDGPLGRGTI